VRFSFREAVDPENNVMVHHLNIVGPLSLLALLTMIGLGLPVRANDVPSEVTRRGMTWGLDANRPTPKDVTYVGCHAGPVAGEETGRGCDAIVATLPAK
jgi:hypothetical protein